MREVRRFCRPGGEVLLGVRRFSSRKSLSVMRQTAAGGGEVLCGVRRFAGSEMPFLREGGVSRRQILRRVRFRHRPERRVTGIRHFKKGVVSYYVHYTREDVQ